MTIFNITIISDTVCPWCYIGYRRLQKAIQTFQKTYPGGSKDTFRVRWKPYYLDVDASAATAPRNQRMDDRMGAKRAEEVRKHMLSVGATEGISFDFGGQTGNSRLSHRLLHFAESKDTEFQSQVAEILFRVHFEESKDISDVETLVGIAAEAGLNGEEVRKYLESGKGAEEVDEEARSVREKGVRGVPHLIFDEKHQFDGAVDVGELFEALVGIKEASA